MGKYTTIIVKEEIEELKSLRTREKNHRLKTRIQSLILTKENKFKTREELANHLGVGVSSLYRWTEVYKESGIEAMLKISNGGLRRKSITKEVHQGLEEKLKDSTKPLLGYFDAQQWVQDTYSIEYKYNTLRTYMIRNFKTKLKTPRKSHYKKDEQAIEAFKKNT
jgi:transposase